MRGYETRGEYEIVSYFILTKQPVHVLYYVLVIWDVPVRKALWMLRYSIIELFICISLLFVSFPSYETKLEVTLEIIRHIIIQFQQFEFSNLDW